MSAILAAAMIHFSIPLNATADQVEDVIGIIKDTFNYVAPGEIDPPGTLPPGVITALPGQTATVASADIDSAGIPWDARIHSSSKNKTEDGKWRKRRGVDDATFKKIEKALLSAAAAPAATAGAGPALPATPAANGLPPLPGANTVIDPNQAAFAALMDLIARNTTSTENPAGRLNAQWVSQCLVAYGIPDGNIQTLAGFPDKVKEVHAYIETALAG